MKKISGILMALALLAGCAGKKTSVENATADGLSKPLDNLFAFFDNNSYNDSLGVYFSEVDNAGKLLSEKVFTVAHDRLIYGLSYTSDQHPERLAKAKRMYAFQKENLIGNDSLGLFSHSFSEKGMNPKTEILDVWQQAYGMCGLAELYRKTGDKQLLETIHGLHKGFINRFHDDIRGGFWGEYHRKNGPVEGSKSLQSLMYPITAYMANLWLADKENRNLYEPYLTENLALLAKNAWNDGRGWVNVKFDDNWNPCESQGEKPCFTVTPGHNFQLSALLQRTKDFGFLPASLCSEYTALGRKILDVTMRKPVFDETVKQGFFSEINPATDSVLDKRKTWWQHAEAVIALTLAGDGHKNEADKIKAFFFDKFQDYENGGEYFYISEDDVPHSQEMKGSIGKSTYHTIELVRFLRESSLKKEAKQ
ncbi:hypothetical protein FUAX_04580 [Fulvitalea axinellae]|uniref:N-acylglucosamine 2-epimerase n=1 Tax=Fulvitalea axinellae TaxID=1182444 RepID=A0AAU9CGY5_9BACT|nr:hypothetical protein FUAX_04580 [Fulvitalea axinellae]